MSTTYRLFLATLVVLLGLWVPLSAQQPLSKPDQDIANAPVHPSLTLMNQAMLRYGVNAQVTQMALMVDRDYPPGQPTLYVADRSLRLSTQFVANDPRRRSNVGLEWTFDTRRSTPRTLVNGIEGILTSAETVQQTRNALNRWTALPCYSADFGEVPYPIAPGYENVEWVDDFYLGLEPQRFQPVAEVTIGGFLPASFFRLISAHGDNILGVTYTFTFRDPVTGLPTDVDHNGKLDSFWTEIYFNDLDYWGDATLPGVDPSQVIDLETVALHEGGHAFGLGHFGRTSENHGGFFVAGYNIMSQAYFGPFRQLSGTPTGGFCSIYGDWQ